MPVSFPLVLCAARSVRYRRSSRMMLGGAGGVRMSCGLRPVGLLRSCGLARVRSCGFDGLTFGACPTVPGCAVFERASGPLRGVLPGSASGLLLGLLGDAEQGHRHEAPDGQRHAWHADVGMLAAGQRAQRLKGDVGGEEEELDGPGAGTAVAGD